MCLCLKTYGIEPFMTWPINAMNVLNLSFFFSFERLPKHRAKEHCPCFDNRTGYDMFFVFFW